MGNGRAVAILFARQGAKLLLADNRLASARETRDMIRAEGHDAEVCEADVLLEVDCQQIVADARARFGRIDVLHYNVGKSEGDAEPAELEIENWDAIMDLNLRGFYLCCKSVLPVMRQQQGGVILGVSSAAAIASGNNVTYKASKAGMNALVQSMAVENGKHGIRVNSIMPGLMDTPMAIERRAREMDIPRDKVREMRDRVVPLNRKMGTAWDVAYAALFLASDDAKYISGVALAVDGALTARVG
jgi:NAD(P)-dependent dehydrogenase (short-subunit alcohol dehydrogenase family)